MHDVIVIGGGPAGTAAATTAARAGARVLLLERGRYPRHKVCGEFVSAESLELLSDLVDDSVLVRDALRIARARIFLDGHVLEAAIEPVAASITRFELDDALWRSAVTAGVDARQHTTVRSIQGREPFHVSTSLGEFTARALINCSGRWSNLRSSNHVPPDKWIGLKAHFAEPSSPDSVDLYFFEGGYCGVSPVRVSGNNGGAGVNVCAMVRAAVASSLPAVFQRNRELAGRASDWRELMDPVSTAPLVFFDPQPARDGVLLAGDAAGFVDPFVGDGISLALRSGTIAAQCLTSFFRGEKSLSAAIGAYSDAYQNSLRSVFRMSSRIRRMLHLPRAVRKPLVSVLEKTPAITTYLVSRTR